MQRYLFFLFFAGLMAHAQMTEKFQTTPSDGTAWTVIQSGTGQLSHQPGLVTMTAEATNPASQVEMRSKAHFRNPELSVELMHAGKGRTLIGLWSEKRNAWAAWLALDTDDTDYLNASVGGASTDWLHEGTPYMKKWVRLRIQVRGRKVEFFAGRRLIQKFVFPPGWENDTWQVVVRASSVSWKSGPNRTEVREVTVKER